MSSMEEIPAAAAEEQRLKPFEKKHGSVIPKERKLVKTMVFEAIFSCGGSSAKINKTEISSDGEKGRRVYPTAP